jgi:hypothetical protein
MANIQTDMNRSPGRSAGSQNRSEFLKDFRPNLRVNGKYLFPGKGAGYREFQVLYIQVKRADKYSHGRIHLLNDVKPNKQ